MSKTIQKQIYHFVHFCHLLTFLCLTTFRVLILLLNLRNRCKVQFAFVFSLSKDTDNKLASKADISKIITATADDNAETNLT
ncbi:hypothetical protein CHE29_03960 [Salmonella enterica]|nr:hypothetical protein CHE29_03960 [Salmonella enterica]